MFVYLKNIVYYSHHLFSSVIENIFYLSIYRLNMKHYKEIENPYFGYFGFGQPYELQARYITDDVILFDRLRILMCETCFMPAIMYGKSEMRQAHCRSCAVRAQELKQEDGWDIDWFLENRTIKELIDENEESWFDRETTLANLRKTLCVVCTERPSILNGDCCGRQVLCWPCHRVLNARGCNSCPKCRTEYALFTQNLDFQNLVEFY